MKVILTGATGYVGEGVLLGCTCSMPEMVNAMYGVVTNGFRKPNLEAWDIQHLRN